RSDVTHAREHDAAEAPEDGEAILHLRDQRGLVDVAAFVVAAHALRAADARHLIERRIAEVELAVELEAERGSFRELDELPEIDGESREGVVAAPRLLPRHELRLEVASVARFDGVVARVPIEREAGAEEQASVFAANDLAIEDPVLGALGDLEMLA